MVLQRFSIASVCTVLLYLFKTQTYKLNVLEIYSRLPLSKFKFYDFCISETKDVPCLLYEFYSVFIAYFFCHLDDFVFFFLLLPHLSILCVCVFFLVAVVVCAVDWLVSVLLSASAWSHRLPDSEKGPKEYGVPGGLTKLIRAVKLLGTQTQPKIRKEWQNGMVNVWLCTVAGEMGVLGAHKRL